MAKKVFVSYDHSEDADYRDLLRAWDTNIHFDFDFDLRSPTVAIDSTEASVIQGVLTKKDERVRIYTCHHRFKVSFKQVDELGN